MAYQRARHFNGFMPAWRNVLKAVEMPCTLTSHHRSAARSATSWHTRLCHNKPPLNAKFTPPCHREFRPLRRVSLEFLSPTHDRPREFSAASHLWGLGWLRKLLGRPAAVTEMARRPTTVPWTSGPSRACSAGS